ncbi:Protein of unknown function [Eubacterium ruminantium]|nr:Protein of unknown function [Eubacterium ruminantium]
MSKMKVYENETFSYDRSFSNQSDVNIKNCLFDGGEEAENAFLGSGRLIIESSSFDQYSPFWNVHKLKIEKAEFTKSASRALWYSDHINITETSILGDKALRECSYIEIKKCDIKSDEFGWFSKFVNINDSEVEGGYFMLKAENMAFRKALFRGNSPFQYIKNATFENCKFEAGDSFWHGENVLIKDSEIDGDCFGWYSDRLLLINCKIRGSRALCYCKNLRILNCDMEGVTNAFEGSEVEAELSGGIGSIINPAEGVIKASNIGEVVMDSDNPRFRIIEV